VAKIFISYRRDDTGFAVDQLYSALKDYVPNPAEDIFIDIDSIPKGIDFVKHLEEKLKACELMLVAIGPNWLTSANPTTDKRRLDDPKDFVRLEVATGLRRGDIRIIPILFGGTNMPTAADLPSDLEALPRRQAVTIDRGRFDEVVADLAQELGLSKRKYIWNRYRWGIASMAGLAALLFGGLLIQSIGEPRDETATVSAHRIGWVHIGTMRDTEWVNLKFDLPEGLTKQDIKSDDDLVGLRIEVPERTGAINIRAGDEELQNTEERARTGVNRPVIGMLVVGEKVEVLDSLRIIDGEFRQVWIRVS